jgi:hypothetical protein
MVKTEDMTFRTNAPASAIRIPESVQGPPYVLDQPGAVYVLTEDVTADGTAFDIQANNVTLDLDGHKVVYGLRSEEASHGVVAKSKQGLRLVNGIVHQGSAAAGKSYPVFLSGCAETEVCGLDVKYGDTEGQGILVAWAKEDEGGLVAAANPLGSAGSFPQRGQRGCSTSRQRVGWARRGACAPVQLVRFPKWTGNGKTSHKDKTYDNRKGRQV